MERIAKGSTQRLYRKVINELGDYAHFVHEVIDGDLHIRGFLNIGHDESDSFHIEIVVTERFPAAIPRVYELDGRIPPVLDRHFMTDGSGCCLVIPHQYREIYDGSTPFYDFINKLVIPFFQNQLHYEITGEFAIGYSHGLSGMHEYYKEIFGAVDDVTLCRLIDSIRLRKVAGHRSCPCLSGKLQRNCHGKGLIKLLRFGHQGHLAEELIRCNALLHRRNVLQKTMRDYRREHSVPSYVKPSASILRQISNVTPVAYRS